jgi:prepilin-type N-terminal cleavage/methylation domain-containing protein
MNLRRGFTLVEMLVTIAILGILFAMSLPAIAAARSAARRAECANHLRQLSTALANYQWSQEAYPAGVIDVAGPIESKPSGHHHSWIVALLPYIEEANAYGQVDRAASVYHDNNAPLRALTPAVLVCPSDQQTTGVSSYCGIHHHAEAPIDAGNSGAFFLNSRLAPSDFVDGLSFTLFLSEKLYEKGDLGWMSGTRATLRNVGAGINVTGMPPPTPVDPDGYYSDDYSLDASEIAEANERARKSDRDRDDLPAAPPSFVGGPGSDHPQGAHFAAGDGAVHYLTESIDRQLLSNLAHRADGAPALEVKW